MNNRNDLVAIREGSVEKYPSDFDLDKVPLIALRHKCRMELSKLLNPTKIFPSEEGYSRDWRGIAYLAGKCTKEISSHHDPIGKLLQLWTDHNRETATCGQLLKFLGLIDRYDVADDIIQSVVEDAKYYYEEHHNENIRSALREEKTEKDEILKDLENNIITQDDAIRFRQGLPPQQYDAFVLFADEDIDFATEIIERMEECGLKLCVKERDMVGGVTFEHEAVMRLIGERCTRLVVVVSRAFLKSSANTFFVNFAQALSIDQGRRKIIPCLYDRCELPLNLSYYVVLCYFRAGRLYNFWDKLRDSILSSPYEMVAHKSRNETFPKITITEIKTSTKEIENYVTAPIKAPRRRKEKQNTNLLCPSVKSEQSITCSSIDLTCNSNSPAEIRRQIMPPPPRLRNSVSLVDINVTTSSMPSSEISANDTLNGETIRPSGKKSKWYSKILSPNSISNGIKTEKKIKKPWFRKKLSTLNS